MELLFVVPWAILKTAGVTYLLSASLTISIIMCITPFTRSQGDISDNAGVEMWHQIARVEMRK